jgi:threonine aldolase
MIDAMASAPLGDDVYAEDPTVNALQTRLATLFGKEKALFFSHGNHGESGRY